MDKQGQRERETESSTKKERKRESGTDRRAVERKRCEDLKGG